MKNPVIRTADVEWGEKRAPSLTPDRKGLFKNLSTLHGIEQFEARITRIPPGESNTWYHTHSHIEEWFYVISGSCHLNLQGTWSIISAGDSIATGPGEWHTFRNFGDQDCDILMVGINDARDKAERSDEPALSKEE